MSALATVKSCSTTACSYNSDGCTAFAVTIGGSQGAASCGTFVALDARGGLAAAQSQVGACQRLECAHNSELMCTAGAISVGGDNATCELHEVA